MARKKKLETEASETPKKTRKKKEKVEISVAGYTSDGEQFFEKYEEEVPTIDQDMVYVPYNRNVEINRKQTRLKTYTPRHDMKSLEARITVLEAEVAELKKNET